MPRKGVWAKWGRLFAAGSVTAVILLLLRGANTGSVFAKVAPTPGVEVTREQMVIFEADRGFANVNLIVQDVMEIVNKGKEDQPSVVIPLAQGAQGLKIDEGPAQGEFSEAEQAFVDRRPLKAGETRRYSFNYGLGFPALPNVIARPLLYPVADITIAVPASLFTIKGPGLTDKGTVLMGQVEIRRYVNTKPLAADPDFSFTVDKGERKMSPWLWAWLALFILPLAGLVAIRTRSARLKSARFRGGLVAGPGNRGQGSPSGGRLPSGGAGSGHPRSGDSGGGKHGAAGGQSSITKGR